MSKEPVSYIRESARRRIALDGPEAQALEVALHQAERQLAAKERECEGLRNRAREISEDYVPQHESEVALALDEMRTEIAALSEGGEFDRETERLTEYQSAASGLWYTHPGAAGVEA